MPSLNKAMIMGHLGKDPEVRHTNNGKTVTSFSVATSERWKDKTTNEYQDKTEWHNITVFGQPAEYVGKYAKKGSLVYVEGQIETQKYQKDGQDRYITKIIARDVKLMDKKEGGSNGNNNAPAPDDSDTPF
jgi:single-strand DNA-binding protein